MVRYRDEWDYGEFDWEEDDRRRILVEKRRLQGLSPEQLGREWRRHCRRHDSAVDRCEELNSPTIEDAAGWMRFIETEFARRELRHYDFTLRDE